MRNRNGKKVLIVEDEPAISRICEKVLTLEAFEVDIAANGKIAQKMIEKKQYDFYLFDIRMPEVDGKELYLWLDRKHPKLTRRVIFTTWDVVGGDTPKFLHQTGRPWLPKPFAPAELKAIMTKALNKRSTRKQYVAGNA
jgi:DNA-binding response OmpR family regulator